MFTFMKFATKLFMTNQLIKVKHVDWTPLNKLNLGSGDQRKSSIKAHIIKVNVKNNKF